MRAFICDCEFKNFNEAMFVGIPLICIPKMPEEKYNAFIGEYLGIAKWIEMDKIIKEFGNILNIIFKEKSLLKRSEEISKEIKSKNIFGEGILNTFFNAIDNALNED
uniref:Uncharacterized protein n=1 Tax=Meloidogyne enterolobii TaxID=390850 RepID=A0A6V7WIC0_MELEN|nr:unnamed protein product [Meloidogyne enterolobii]